METTINYKCPRAVFLNSSAYFREMPKPLGDEFALLGRSNVGKSSFVNHVLENGNLARVSKTPGKTSLANLYKLDEDTYWVDLPGYGYAKVSGEEKVRWSELIADYCSKRSNLRGILWLIDSRHIGVKADMEAFGWLKETGKPVFPVLTKGDKLSSTQKKQAMKAAIDTFSFHYEPIMYSIMDNTSKGRFWEQFYKWRKGL